MGYIKHHAIIVTSWDDASIMQAYKKATEIFKPIAGDDLMISGIIHGLVNDQKTFIITPDGSKEGWDISNYCNETRALFIQWLKDSTSYLSTPKIYCDYIEVSFGGDDESAIILNTKPY